jgi:hypothetical protein
LGLRLADVAALEAPWFLDRDHTDRYQDAVFANNARLAADLADSGKFFENVSHPVLDCARGGAPFASLASGTKTCRHIINWSDWLKRNLKSGKYTSSKVEALDLEGIASRWFGRTTPPPFCVLQWGVGLVGR